MDDGSNGSNGTSQPRESQTRDPRRHYGGDHYDHYPRAATERMVRAGVRHSIVWLFCRICAALPRRTDGQDGLTLPISVAQLSRETNLSARAVYRALRFFEAIGMTRVAADEGRNRRNRYDVSVAIRRDDDAVARAWTTWVGDERRRHGSGDHPGGGTTLGEGPLSERTVGEGPGGTLGEGPVPPWGRDQYPPGGGTRGDPGGRTRTGRPQRSTERNTEREVERGDERADPTTNTNFTPSATSTSNVPKGNGGMRRAMTDEPTLEVERDPGPPDGTLVAELVDLAGDAARLHLAVEWVQDPAEADAWFGRRARDPSTLRDFVALLGAPACRRHDPRALFALAPFFCPADSLARPAGLAPGLGQVARLLGGEADGGASPMSIQDLRDLDDVVRAALAAIPRGGGYANAQGKRWSLDLILKTCRGVGVLRANVLGQYGALAPYFDAVYRTWADFVQKCAHETPRDTGGRARPLPPKLCLWDMLSRKYDPLSTGTAKPAPQRTDDPWWEIRAFLGLPDDCKFSDGWIPVGFAIHHHHEALGMQASPRRANPLTGTVADIASINGASYTIRGGHQYSCAAHHVEARPKGYLLLCCTPENFHVFRERWRQDLARVAPSLEEYRQYGWQRADLEADDSLMGVKVPWRRS